MTEKITTCPTCGAETGPIVPDDFLCPKTP